MEELAYTLILFFTGALTHAFSVFEPQLEESRKAIDVMLHFFEKTTNA